MSTKFLLSVTLLVLLLASCATRDDRAAQRNKELVLRYFDQWVNRSDPAAVNRLIATNLVLRNPPYVFRSLEEYQTRMAAFHAAFPDARYTIEEQIAEADKVAVRWTLRGTQSGDYQGQPASRKKIAVTGISLLRIAEGQIQEITVNMDRLGLMEQLGWLPAAPPPAQ